MLCAEGFTGDAARRGLRRHFRLFGAQGRRKGPRSDAPGKPLDAWIRSPTALLDAKACAVTLTGSGHVPLLFASLQELLGPLAAAACLAAFVELVFFGSGQALAIALAPLGACLRYRLSALNGTYSPVALPPPRASPPVLPTYRACETWPIAPPLESPAPVPRPHPTLTRARRRRPCPLLRPSQHFPVGTFAANISATVVACILAGLAGSDALAGGLSAAVLSAIGTGVCGSLSTVVSFRPASPLPPSQRQRKRSLSDAKSSLWF